MENTNKIKIAVAMSGGVDSSITAFLLKEKGYNVFGFTMKLFTLNNSSYKCKIEESINEANRSANILKIPHYVIDLKDEFKEKVIAPFVMDYCSGKTPSPCILCNSYIKFGILLDKALSLGADGLATGHYAKVSFNENNNRWILEKAVDKSKDQSYFLFNLTQEQLSKALFPLSDFTKKDVKKMAKSLNFAITDKPESQELCFIANNDYRSFIKDYSSIQNNEGNFISLDGKVLGKHKGIHHYTIGQRRGLGLSFGKPIYVVNINPENNTITIGEKKDLYSSELLAENLNWIAIEKLEKTIKACAKIRYKHEEALATIIPISESQIHVIFDEPQKAITPGQAIVLYDGDILLGGGFIKERL